MERERKGGGKREARPNISIDYFRREWCNRCFLFVLKSGGWKGVHFCLFMKHFLITKNCTMVEVEKQKELEL